MYIKFTVTEQDIQQGIIGDTLLCPVALALRRTFNKSIHVGPGQCDKWVLSKNKRKYLTQGIPMSNVMYKWVRRFDSGKSVKPHTFILKVPDGWV